LIFEINEGIQKHICQILQKKTKYFLWKADNKEKYGTYFTNLNQISMGKTIFSKYFQCNADNRNKKL